MQEKSQVKKTLLILGAMALVALAVWYLLGNRASYVPKPIGYVVCGCRDYDPDNRLYRIDLETGRVLSVSEKLPWMGRANHIALDADRMRLYVASMRGNSSYEFFSLSIVEAGKGQAGIVKQSAIEIDEGRASLIDGFSDEVVEAYLVHLSHDGNELYAMHGGTDSLETVIDPMTGAVLRELDIVLDSESVFSSDGRYVWRFLPCREQREEVDGLERTSQRPGSSLIYDTLTGEEKSRIILTSKEEYPAALLQANQWGPWQTPNGPRVRLEKGHLVAYDRDTYQILSRANISDFLEYYGSGFPEAFDDGRRVVMTVGFERRVGTNFRDDGFGGAYEEGIFRRYSHAAAFDVQTGELLFSTPIGLEIDSDYCTNVEIAYE